MAEALIERLNRLADTAYALGNVGEANAIRDLIVALEQVNGRPEELDISELIDGPGQDTEDLPDENF